MTLAAAMTVSLTLGCLLLSLLQHMVQARWGVLLVELFERGIGPWSFLVIALSLMPLLLHPALVYDWARGRFPLQAWWLSIEPFRLRSAFYLLFWLGLSSLLRRATRQNTYATNLAAPGFFLVCLTGTFAAFDWVMSLELPFASSVYGMLFLAAGVLGAMGLCVATLCFIDRSERFDFALRRDYGNLLFTMVMIWAYLAFVQYLICWSANLRDEVPYFLRRSIGGWAVLGDALVVIGFFGPFFMLLAPRIRGSLFGLGAVAIFTVVVWGCFTLWLAGPALPAPWWVDVGAVLAMGLLWVSAFALGPTAIAQRRPVIV